MHGVNHGCNQFEHKITHQASLRQHIQLKYDGNKNDCNQCNYKATLETHLRKKKSKYKGDNMSVNNIIKKPH